MGSGLSMASVNKIKELANAREYSLALDIIDSQDLSKSLNPQFLRLCGEVYTYNRRYGDARKVLLNAHRLAPEAKRIIYSLVYLYLKMGYRELARTYYEIYMFDADEAVLETKQMMYIYDKAQKHNVDDLEQYIAPAYSHTMDYDWTYETFLIYMLQGRRKEAENLAEIYEATFRNSENSFVMESVLSGGTEANELFDVFASEELPDDEPEQEAERELEQKLLEADDLRIHPREPEITIMVDDEDDDEIEIGSKRKLKKFLKEQERLEREGGAGQEEMVQLTGDVPQPEEAESEEGLEDKKGKKRFKGIFQKKKKEQTEQPDAEMEKRAEEKEPANVDAKSVEMTQPFVTEEEKKPQEEKSATEDKESEEAEKPVSGDNKSEEAEKPATGDKRSEETEKPAAEDKRQEEYEKARAIFFGDASEPQADLHDKKSKGSSAGIQLEAADAVIEETEELPEDIDSEIKQSQKNEGSDMRKMHVKQHNSKRNSIVSVDFEEEDFTAESETIEDLKDESDSGNLSDSLYLTPQETPVSEFKIKKSITFEEADMADEDDEPFETDDFSTPDEDEFGKMRMFTYENISDTADEGSREEIDDTEEAFTEEETVEEITEETAFGVKPDEATETEIEAGADEEPETEIEVGADEEEEAEIEAGANEEEEAEIETEADEEAETEIEAEADEEAEAGIEVEAEEEAETEIEAEADEEAEAEEEAETEIEEVLQDEIDKNSQAYEAEAEESQDFMSESEPENLAELFKQTPKKKALDYPVFRSSLFPDYHKEVVEVTNNFEDIMHEANDKIQENLLKEEQMQREAEALLASLGIDMESVSVTAEDYDSVSEALYDGPSRDELKASLKIDFVKKDILRKLKEYR